MANNITTNSSSDRTVRVFNNFYNYTTNVSQNDYDVIYSFFKSFTNNDEQAKSYTTSFFQAATAGNTDPMELFQEFQNKNFLELNTLLAYYLNSNRHSSSLLGIGVVTTPNYYAARNVIV